MKLAVAKSKSWTFPEIMQSSLKTEWLKSCLLFFIFLLFMLISTSSINIGTGSFPGFSLNFEQLYSSVAKATPELFILLGSGIILTLTLPILKPIVASILILVLAIPPVYLGISFPYRNPIPNMQFSLLVLLVLFGLNVLLDYFSQTQKKQQILNTFGKFVPPEIVKEMSLDPDNVSLDGEAKEMTVLFCDIQNFSTISENISPKELVSMLNEFLTVMTTVLYKYGATIDKYIGDSIMAFWNAPIDQPDHAQRAVLAGMEMLQEVNHLRHKFQAIGLPEVSMGIGINTGIMNVGNMGSSYRLAYTVIGDAVNLSSRLQELTRNYQTPMIVGEKTASSAEAILFKELDTVQVKGKNNYSRIYQPVGIKTQLSEISYKDMDKHNEGLEAYYAGTIDKAAKIFMHLEKDSPDQPYYKYMLQQIASKKS